MTTKMNSPKQRRFFSPLAALAIFATTAIACGDDYLEPVHSQIFDNNNDACGQDIAFDTDGNIIVIGTYEGRAKVGGEELPLAPGTSYFLAKYDPDGKHLWSKQIEVEDSDIHIVTKPNGSIIIAGNFSNNLKIADMKLSASSRDDIFLAKLSHTGDVEWIKQFGGVGSSYVRSIAIDTQENLVIAGSFSGTVSFGSKSLEALGRSDGLVVQFDENGVPKWARRFGNLFDFDSIERLSVSMPGEITISGNQVGQINANTSEVSVQIATFSSEGELKKSWQIGAGHLAWSNNAQDLYIHSSVETPQTLGSGTTELSGEFLARVDPSGEVLWSVPAESREWRGIAVDDEDRVHLISDSRVGSGHGRFVWVTSYSKEGAKLGRSEIISEIGGAQAVAIATGPEGKIAVTGCVRDDGFVGTDEKVFLTVVQTP